VWWRVDYEVCLVRIQSVALISVLYVTALLAGQEQHGSGHRLQLVRDPSSLQQREADLELVYREIDSSSEKRACVIVRLSGGSPISFAPLPTYQRAVATIQEALLAELERSAPLDSYEVRYQYENVSALCLEVNSVALSLISNHPSVDRIGLDSVVHGALDTSRAFLGVDTVHTTHGLTGAGITVAVLDTGIDTDHPDLSDDVASGAFHFLGAGGDSGPGAEDDSGHGTFVSGIITSKGAIAPLGVAPDAEILAVKVLDSNNTGFSSDWIAGVDYVISVHEDYPNLVAINMSLQDFVEHQDCPCDDTTPTGRTLQDLFLVARFEGIVPFVCSGNQGACGSLTMPGCLSGAVAVGAVDVRSATPVLASFTNKSECLELLAPGVGIESTWIGGGTSTGSGCSYSTPFATATAALLADSCLSANEVVSVLTSEGTPFAHTCLAPEAPILSSLDAVVEAQSIYLASTDDCNSNSVLDRCELDGADCDGNGVLDVCDLASGSPDCNSNGVPDVCEADCNGNGTADECDIASGTSTDCDSDGIPDDCEVAGPGIFVRGNAQGDFVDAGAPFLSINMADGIFVLQYLFQSGPTPPCLDATDVNDDGRVNLVDAIHLFMFLTGGGVSVPHPYWFLDQDPSPDSLDCEQPPSLVRC